MTEPRRNVWKIEIEVLLKSCVNRYTSNEKMHTFSARIVKKRRFLKMRSTRMPESSTPQMLPTASHDSSSLIPV